MDLPRLAVLGILLAAYIVLGMFLEGFAMLVLTLPIVHPIILTLGYDPIWFGVVMVIVLEMGLISPPVGSERLRGQGHRRGRPHEPDLRRHLPVSGSPWPSVWPSWWRSPRSRCSCRIR